MLCMWCVSPLEICLKSNKTMYDCDATVLLNVYVHLVFVGNGYVALVPSNLPRLRKLSFMGCDNVHDEYVTELKNVVPKVEFLIKMKMCGKVALRILSRRYLLNNGDYHSEIFTYKWTNK